MVKDYVIEKCEKEGFILYDGAESFLEEYKDTITKQKFLEEFSPFGDEIFSCETGENDYKVFDDINTFKNIMVYAQITSYKGINFNDMEYEEKENIMEFIIENMKTYDVEPICYKKENNIITVGWYLNDVINTFRFGEGIDTIFHE